GRPRVERVILAGRSMGGRMGTYLAADGVPMDGLILFAYPLHPAGRPEKLRKDHLPDIEVPMLFVVGTRDALATMDLYDRWVRPLPGVTTVEIEDGDHSFRVRKASGRTNEQATQEVVAAAVEWLGSLDRGD
ncbi:MAG: dienelactone hydrolase family protein, partial [Acidimicrobiia bacterium]|nr:dienelactone hydrolase family protein [Acidimicrobiia bacterium]